METKGSIALDTVLSSSEPTFSWDKLSTVD